MKKHVNKDTNGLILRISKELENFVLYKSVFFFFELSEATILSVVYGSKKPNATGRRNSVISLNRERRILVFIYL